MSEGTPLVIGLDLGTLSCKAVAMGSDGNVVAAASRGYGLLTPRPGWGEQDPHGVWRAAKGALRNVAGRVAPAALAGLCLSGAMHTLLPVDSQGAPLAHAMTWADHRAIPQSASLRARCDPHALYRRTGCPLRSAYYPARLRWWQETTPAVAQAAFQFVAIKDWVLHHLTGVWATDVSLASSTGLLDIHRLVWVDEALSLAGVTAAQLPSLVSTRSLVGELTVQGAADTGLPAGLPVVTGASDGAMANVGAGAVTAGDVVVTVGSSGAIRKVLDAPWLDDLERTWCYVSSEEGWFAGGAVNNAGLAVDWVRQCLYPDLPHARGYRRLLLDAASVPAGADGVLILPYLGGERSPHWDTPLSGVVHGLRLDHTRAHLARAVLEAVAFCLADVWEAVGGGHPAGQPVPLTGGITRARLWAQIVADVLGIPLAPVEAADASALGAATVGWRALVGRGEAPPRPATAEGPPASSDRTTGSHAAPVVWPDDERHALYVARHDEFRRLYEGLTAGS